MGAKKSTKINGAYEKKCAHLIAGQQRKIGHIYDQACDEAADIASFVGSLADGEGFSFSSPLTKRKAKQMLTRLKNDLQAVLVDGVNSAWTLANDKNNELARAVFGNKIGKLPKDAYSRYFSSNDTARQAFLARKANGLGLSERVWELGNNFEQLIERGVEYGIRTGADASKMARDLKLYLQHPDELFRRVRDKKSGNLKLSENAKAFSPGRGVYRSSYKNALRLARTETNMAYRTADFERINQLDFVVGIKVVLSNNHTSLGADGKAHDLYDICDELQGDYPKDFKFVGWHPHCRCHVETILKTDEEFDADNARILNGEEPQSGSVNEVKQVPANFKDWLENNIERTKGRASLPYFIADNPKQVAKALGIYTEPKKTPLEIAKERHEARTKDDIAAIQEAWNRRRLESLSDAISDGYLPMECDDSISFMLGINTPKNFEEINASIATLQKAVNRHKARTSQKVDDLKKAWAAKIKRDETTKRVANNVLKLRSEYPNDVDFTTLEKLVADNNLSKMPAEYKKVAKTISAMRAEEKALSNLIPNAHEWHKTHSIAELKVAHGKIQSTIDYWKGKGYDLATDSNLDILKNELEQKIKFVENPGAFKAGLTPHSTWKVQQEAYNGLLGKVEARIETKAAEADYKALLGFKTASKEFKYYMGEAKKALDAGDTAGAKNYLASAQWKKSAIEAKKSASSTAGGTSSPFSADAYSQKRKNNALWDKGDGQKADDALIDTAEKVWTGAPKAEKDAVFGYTGSYCHINEPLQGRSYYGSQKRKAFERDVNNITSYIDKSELPCDMWFTRGDDGLGVIESRIKFAGGTMPTDLQGLVGKVMQEGGFMSTGSRKGQGFGYKSVIINVYAPKGTKAAYVEPFSEYGNGAKRAWNGKDRFKTFSDEHETLFQRGTKMRITKVYQNNGKTYIDCEVIGQDVKDLSYVKDSNIGY